VGRVRGDLEQYLLEQREARSSAVGGEARSHTLPMCALLRRPFFMSDVVRWPACWAVSVARTTNKTRATRRYARTAAEDGAIWQPSTK
jgi:hypothetical protein